MIEVDEGGAATKGLRILLVDDDVLIVRAVSQLLGREGHEVIRCARLTDALVELDHEGDWLDVVVTDLQLPDGTGHALVRKVRDRLPTTGIVVVTGRRPPHFEPDVIVLSKPVEPAELLAAVTDSKSRAMTREP